MKVIALDLDETLLKTDKTISDRTKLAIERAKSLGVKIVINSARSLPASIKIMRDINADYMCLELGNLVMDNNLQIVSKRPFKKELQKTLYEELNKYSDKIYLGLIDEFIGHIDDKNKAEKWSITNGNPEKYLDGDIYKICVMFENNNIRENVENICRRYNLSFFTMRDAPTIIMYPTGSNKWYGLESLINNLGVNKKDLYVFGDDNSDLLSLKNAGHGIAMANSRQNVLSEIYERTLSNDEDGVASYIEENILN